LLCFRKIYCEKKKVFVVVGGEKKVKVGVMSKVSIGDQPLQVMDIGQPAFIRFGKRCKCFFSSRRRTKQ
jgi:hypothetical protein